MRSASQAFAFLLVVLFILKFISKFSMQFNCDLLRVQIILQTIIPSDHSQRNAMNILVALASFEAVAPDIENDSFSYTRHI